MFLPFTGKLPFKKGRYLSKTLLIMKFIAIFMFAAGLQVSATGYAQNITLAQKNVSLKKVFKEIERQSGYSFFYKDRLLTQTEKVDVNVKDASVKAALDQCLRNTSLSYTILDKIIVIKAKNLVTPAVSVEETAAPAPENIIAGTVKDAQGNPLPGVSVIIKGSTKGTSTNAEGKFTIDANVGDVLEFSIVGYGKKSVTVSSVHEINVRLEVEAVAGNEIVVVGYGTQRKKDLTGSVATIGQKDLTQGINTNAIQSMNGKAAGVYISQSSSAPGGGVNIRIRGAGSINSSNAVLIVVDGLPGVDPSSISQDDIESIQVLKDASAAAIYGSRAANGVVLITTNKGKIGKPAISYNSYIGLQEASKTIDVLNAQQYMQVINALNIAQGQNSLYTQQQIDTTKGTDWQNEIFQKAYAQNHQLSISGGSQYNKYYIGLNYLNQQGILKNTNFEKYNGRLNYQITPSDKFNMSLTTNISHSSGLQPYNQGGFNENAGAINTALYFDPTIPATLGLDGRYQFNPLIALENPLAITSGINQTSTQDNSYGTLIANYIPVHGLTFTARLGADINNSRSDFYNSRITQFGNSAGGIGSISTEQDTHWIMEYLGQYDRKLGDHNLSLLLGTTTERYDFKSEGASSQNFLSDITLTNLLQSGVISSNIVNSSRSSNKLNSYLGRFNYNYKDKYLLTASFRSDGTSRFSDTHKYAIFPSLALGWNIHKEAFLQNAKDLSLLKLRFGYGQIGNQAISNFATLQTYIAGGRAIFGNNLYQGAEPARLPNPDLRWETTEEYNWGLDFGFFNNRISGSLEYYIKNSKDQLFSKPTPAFTGFSSQLVNFGNVQNSGVDVQLVSQNFRGKTFKWETNITASFLKNKVTQLPNFIPQLLTGSYAFIPNFALVQVGSPIYSYYGYQVTGIFQTDQQAAASGQPGAKAGSPIFKDQDGNKLINQSDRVILGSPLPDFTWGFANSFSYKRFSLNVLLLGVEGISTLDDNVAESIYPINFQRNRIAKYYLDRWTPDNPNAKYPSGVNPSTYGGQYSVNSYTVKDASFIRLKTVTLNYQLPVKNNTIKSMSAYIAVDNLFTITKFDGYDPDANVNGSSVTRISQNSYPLAKVYRFGISLNF